MATGVLTWRELVAYIHELPTDSRVGRAVLGEIAEWSVTDRVLADVFDVLAAANWQRGGDKNASQPKPYPRPTSKVATEALGRRLRRIPRGGAA